MYSPIIPKIKTIKLKKVTIIKFIIVNLGVIKIKTFDIYENLKGRQEAVKKGWSWPGFSFTWIWCFIKGLGVLGSIILAFTFFGIIVTISYPSEEMSRFGHYSTPPTPPIVDILFGIMPFIIRITF